MQPNKSTAAIVTPQQQLPPTVQQQPALIESNELYTVENSLQEEPIILLGSPNQNVQSQQQPIHFEQACRYLNKIKVY